jgi:GxxExxY protein
MQVGSPVFYDGLDQGLGYRIDLLVGDQARVERKSVDAMSPLRQVQGLWYLTLSVANLWRSL